jgi:membrane fusion protein (multidrug efflux system)
MTKPMRIMLICSVIVFGGIAAYIAFGTYMMKIAMSGRSMPPATVTAMPISPAPWQSRLLAVGTLKAVDGVDVTTEIVGMVDSAPFESGAKVKKGDLLVQLNADVEIASLHSLEAQAELARITYERDKKQLEVQAVSRAQVDLDEADVKSKKALVAQQAAIVARKKILAPFSGRLGISQVNVGQFLNPGDKIVTLQSIDPIFVEYFLPQQELSRIKVGQEVFVSADTYPGQTFKGKVTTINPKVDSATRNVAVEATLANPEGRLLPGMFGQVEITTGAPQEFLTLPQAAITYNPYGDLVYILKEKEKDKDGNAIYTANQKFITLGEKRGDQVQVLKGLEKDDLVVTSGQMKLKNGSLAVVNNTVVPSNDPDPTHKHE